MGTRGQILSDSAMRRRSHLRCSLNETTLIKKGLLDVLHVQRISVTRVFNERNKHIDASATCITRSNACLKMIVNTILHIALLIYYFRYTFCARLYAARQFAYVHSFPRQLLP